MDYTTFAKNGVFKLTEVEVFFLSKYMTKKSSSEWVVVYLGIGDGDRFRCLRDEFFPGLAVVGFDPLDYNYHGNLDDVQATADVWKKDGTSFEFYLRRYDADNDPTWIEERYKGRKFLLISDIRGCAFTQAGGFDKQSDNDVQWQAIKRFRPVSSILKFAVPGKAKQHYDYVPGVILKQVFSNYPTMEVRLLVEGVPDTMKTYDSWELYEKMMYHHECLRGQVYESTKPPNCARCFDNCFDCTVFWNTISEYAQKNEVDPSDLIEKMVKWHVYSPLHDATVYESYQDYKWIPPSPKQRWKDVKWYLCNGLLMEAVAALEAEDPPQQPKSESADEHVDDVDEAEKAHEDWSYLAVSLDKVQPSLAERLRRARPLSRSGLIDLIGSLSEPFTLVKTSLNGLYDTEL